MIIIIFGLAAAGKTYIGQILSENFDFHHEDADQWLTEEMHQFIIEKKIFSLEMLDEFTKIIINHTDKLSKIYPKLIITQALYRQKNRDQIRQYFSDQSILFLQVDADHEITQQRLIKRGDFVTPDYAKDIHKFFEADTNTKIIKNNLPGKDLLIKQFKNIMSEIE